MKLLLALDQGTTSSRAVLFDESLRVLATGREEVPQSYPQSGWVEHDPEILWSTSHRAAQKALAEGPWQWRDVAAIGITNQRETALIWEKATGRPVHPAIVWQDRRTAEDLQQLRQEGYESLVQNRTGLLLDPYFSAAKFRWILQRVPEGVARASRGELAAGTVDSWLLYRLTGGRLHATDVTNASRTMLMRLADCQWDPELLQLFEIPRESLPKIIPTCGALAETDPSIFGCSIPICGVVGDQQAALFGQLCHQPGTMKCTYGTGCFLLAHAGREVPQSRQRLLSTIAWQLAGQPVEYALEGSVFVGGAAIQWLRDGLGLIPDAQSVNALAAQVEDSGGVVLVPAFTGLGAPYWDAEARGTIFGISRGSTAAHLARAVLEGIAQQVTDVVIAMERDLQRPLELLRADGGAAASDPLLQIQADLLGIGVERPCYLESTALGAAMLAGLGVGLWPNPAALPNLHPIENVFSPKISPHHRRHLRETWEKAIARSLRWLQN